MIFLTVVAPLLWAVHAVWGLPGWLTWQLDHPWEGFTCWDIIMPLFIFMCGAAIPLSLERRLERNGGRPDGASRLCHLIFSKSRSYPITTGIKPISPP